VASKCLWALEFGTHRLLSKIALIPESALQFVRQIPLADPTVVICLGLGFRDPLYSGPHSRPEARALAFCRRAVQCCRRRAVAAASSAPSLHLQILLLFLFLFLLPRLLCASAFEIRRASGEHLYFLFMALLSWLVQKTGTGCFVSGAFGRRRRSLI